MSIEVRERGLLYLKNPLVCPHCNSADIQGGDMNYESNEISQQIRCSNCFEEWVDVYKLAAVANMDGKTIASIAIPEEK